MTAIIIDLAQARAARRQGNRSGFWPPAVTAINELRIGDRVWLTDGRTGTVVHFDRPYEGRSPVAYVDIGGIRYECELSELKRVV